MPDVVTFAGETIPIQRTDVREALEYELMVNTFRQTHTLLVIKNVERWRPFVTEILQKSGVHPDFLYLAVIESEFNNNAASYAGAMGMWQIMEKTAKDYDLKMNQDVDMRRDPKLATEAACKYLKWAYSNLNNWVLTAASYNVGMKGIKNRLKSQKVDNFFDLHLNSETSRYVYRILALKLILENPETYGYFVPHTEKYEPFQFYTITVNNDIDNLVDFAKKNNTTYKELRQLNPWFNNTDNFKLRIKKKESYEIRIPQQKIVQGKQ
ncbi:membrane-bound lytic murein transglycosylase D precursor [Sporocytophaga myxococcoides]|uniref:Membrane-bound lytic murein transglycosylase D n=2 Tax=Sporocytophaga myxococcoides TaxID=153721 RepID=A0A098LJS7_9BACT|nr:membrane-bound lytic murein transglycosylase D precursor [Sporocytophaga myxococcoides]